MTHNTKRARPCAASRSLVLLLRLPSQGRPALVAPTEREGGPAGSAPSGRGGGGAAGGGEGAGGADPVAGEGEGGGAEGRFRRRPARPSRMGGGAGEVRPSIAPSLSRAAREALHPGRPWDPCSRRPRPWRHLRGTCAVAERRRVPTWASSPRDWPDADGLAAVPFVVRRIIRRPGAAAGVGAAGALLSPEGVAGRPPAPRGAPTPGKKGRAARVGFLRRRTAASNPTDDGRRNERRPPPVTSPEPRSQRADSQRQRPPVSRRLPQAPADSRREIRM